jgi:hypothetical protein
MMVVIPYGVIGSGPRRSPPDQAQASGAMRDDIQQGRRTVAELKNMLEKNLAETYGVSRDTARKARNAVCRNLATINSRQMPTIDK